MEDHRIDSQINDFFEENREKLRQLFPEVVKDGSVDFDLLRELLGGDPAGGSEKYELTWAGKRRARRMASQDISGYTLNLDREKSLDPDTTKNIYIEGDNLTVLKLLRQNYYCSVKMIYIDPPYNTGNDFIYDDKFTVSQESIDQMEGNVDQQGNRYVVNQRSSNRFHARWLNEMYPLLMIARDFLREDGSIFISIDDNEVANLRQICDEIFGEDNFVACVIWNRKRGRDNSARWFSKSHEYLLVYAKNKNSFETNYLELDEETKKAYKNPDHDPRGPYRVLATWARGTQGGVEYDFTSRDGHYFPRRLWLFSKENMEKMERENRLLFRGDHIYRKLFIHENKGKIPETIWNHTSNAANASDEIKRLFGAIVFDTPKPTPYIQEMIRIATGPGDLIMDFFSGSAATANAVMRQNLEDDGGRRFLLVQIPASCPEKSAAYRQGFSTICHIGRERIIREGKEILQLADHPVDVGFRTFVLSRTNIRWNTPEQAHTVFLNDDGSEFGEDSDHLDFMPGALDENIVYELMLRQQDLLLSEPLTLLPQIGERTFLYGSRHLICLEKKLNRSILEQISRLTPFPFKIIFRDSAFGDDAALKDETLRRLEALIALQGHSAKRTYTVEFI